MFEGSGPSVKHFSVYRAQTERWAIRRPDQNRGFMLIVSYMAGPQSAVGRGEGGVNGKITLATGGGGRRSFQSVS